MEDKRTRNRALESNSTEEVRLVSLKYAEIPGYLCFVFQHQGRSLFLSFCFSAKIKFFYEVCVFSARVPNKPSLRNQSSSYFRKKFLYSLPGPLKPAAPSWLDNRLH